jgi:hypothetical protein
MVKILSHVKALGRLFNCQTAMELNIASQYLVTGTVLCYAIM